MDHKNFKLTFKQFYKPILPNRALCCRKKMPFESFDRPTRHMKSKVLTSSSSAPARGTRQESSSSLLDSKRERNERFFPRGRSDESRQDNVRTQHDPKSSHKKEDVQSARVGTAAYMHKRKSSENKSGSSSSEENEQNARYSSSKGAHARKRQHDEKPETSFQNFSNARSGRSPRRIFDGSSHSIPLTTTPMMPQRRFANNNGINSRQPYFPVPPAPFLRQTSSTHSFYRHQDLDPPQLRLTSSMGLELMSAPLVATPAQNFSPLLPWFSTPGRNATNSNAGAATNEQRLPAPAGLLNFNAPNIPDAVEGLLSMEKGCPPKNPTPDGQPLGESTTTADTSLPGAPSTISVSAKTSSRYDNSSHTPPNRVSFPHRVVSAALHARDSGHASTQFASLASPLPATVYSSAVHTYENTRMPVPREERKRPRDLFKDVPLTDKPCKCSNSRCLKLYCECFHYGVFCDDRLCNCKNCHNNEEHNESRGPREIAIKRILARRPDAFDVKVQKRTGKGCGCKSCG
jgi:hypothetical protein